MDHNYSEETAHTRDTFLISEIDYLRQLSQMPAFIDLYKQYRGVKASELSSRLVTLTQMMENGEVKEEDEEKVELDIMCCCLAIEDATKSLGPRVLTPEPEEERTHGRSR